MKNAFNFELKHSIKQFKEELCESFLQKGNIHTLTHQLVRFIDNTLLILFKKKQLHLGHSCCLIALGSYGRSELQLHSDIDLLILHTETISALELHYAQVFIQDCWDSGLNLSHQITTVKACSELASRDLSVISSILDARLICGAGNLLEELLYQTHPLHMWSSHHYFYEKKQEQNKRYAKYNETAYNLEPNVKYGPGGLRDLQILLSISKRHFHIKKLADGISSGFITDKEYEELTYCQHFLWRVRFALHTLAKKQEEQLLFDYQLKIAHLFGFEDNKHSLGIEQFMKAYFKVIKRSRELNEMLLQWFEEVIVHQERQQIIPLDDLFQLSNHHIEVRHVNVFRQKPVSLFILFLWMAQDPSIQGVRASTIRLIQQNLYLINKDFKNSRLVTNCFIKLFKESNDPYQALHHMNRYGVLGHYLDFFLAVTGQMQYDLFHVYTVDQHTLFVIRNLARFLKPEYVQQFPLAAEIMIHIKKRDILYLAALFHDIAKGRGGDHSELGAEEARCFAVKHHLDQEDESLLVWLVHNHLLMSKTAQQQDIYEPSTIQQFCNQLPQTDYLEYLYLLTVADICATNHQLWNAWKDSLLKELYHAARYTMQHQQVLLDEKTIIDNRKHDALNILMHEGLSIDSINLFWNSLKESYFLHEPSEVIAKHTQAIINCQDYPLVLITPHHSHGGTEVLIYMPHCDERFTITTTIFTNYYTTIQEATILTCSNQFDLDRYVILNESHQTVLDQFTTQTLEQALIKQLRLKRSLPTLPRRLSRIKAHFNLIPQVTFTEDLQRNCTRLFLVMTDKIGLLASISHIFLKEQIHLHYAKIATAGERVEDTFYISNKEGLPLDENQKETLRFKLIAGVK